MLIGAPSSVAFAAACPERYERDYLSPFRNLPRVRPIPQNGHLPFSPQHLVVRTKSSLLAGGGSAGIEIGSDSRRGVYRLEWTVNVTVRRIDSAGSPLGVVGSRTVRLWQQRSFWTEPLSLFIRVPNRPGLYQSEASISKDQRQLGKFTQYLRVVPRNVEVRLTLGQASYAKGETLHARIENRGTVQLSYGPGLALEEWNGGNWDEVGGPKFFGGPVIGIPPGTSGKCEHLPLPTDLQSGRYRVSMSLDGRNAPVRAYFNVD
ncbi:MAG TPA: immunoglobulin-like domain-containing protein [Solirubrobacterales bacterium]|nr:immunoglobulin-like domain-containing protein [Solirubrobacterales bacterium]